MNKIAWNPKLVESLQKYTKEGLTDIEIAIKMNSTPLAIRQKRRKLFIFKNNSPLSRLSPKELKKYLKKVSSQDKEHNKKYRSKNLAKLQKSQKEYKMKIRTLWSIDFNNGNRAAYWDHRIKYLKNNAPRRKLSFNISSLDLEEQWIKQNGKCFYTNVYLKADIPKESVNKETLVSVDRIDSNIGYEKNNIRFVSYDINTMKATNTHHKFIRLCQSIIEHDKLKVKKGIK